MIVGIGLFILVLLYESKIDFPALPIPLLVNRTVVASLIGATITFDTFGLSPSMSGLCMLPVTIGMVVAAFIAGKICRKYLSFFTRVGSCIIQCTGLVLLSLLCKYGVGVIVCILAIISLGIGGFQTSNTGFVTSAAPRNVRGIVGGLVQTFREVGFAMGTSLAGCLQDVFIEAQGQDPDGIVTEQVALKASSGVYIVMAGVSIFSLLAAFISKASPHEINLKGHPQYDPLAKPRIGVENIELNWKKYKQQMAAKAKKAEDEKSGLLGLEDSSPSAESSDRV
ncbi:Major facilitator superfamily like protein [Aduncisulcus paluster]|uniref:Major facilitator superfamily like protein n=1 Tax=Aduncisulcus paluster TaxID=2918883 RepID=A0ABQ5JXB1_9EUKA|nr:Major facilitator superfamily like protein [Aduncisulcus paluster]